jgi:hypothetical protein
MDMKNQREMMLAGENRRTRRKTYPSVTLSTTNPTWIDPGANPGLLSERPTTNCLSRGTALDQLTAPMASQDILCAIELVNIIHFKMFMYSLWKRWNEKLTLRQGSFK